MVRSQRHRLLRRVCRRRDIFLFQIDARQARIRSCGFAASSRKDGLVSRNRLREFSGAVKFQRRGHRRRKGWRSFGRNRAHRGFAISSGRALP